jgi:hypothetical protein
VVSTEENTGGDDMSYVVIDRQGRAARHPGVPTGERLGELVDGIPEKVNTEIPGIVFWVNDDFAGRAQAGTLARNVVGTVLAVGTGAPEQPYAGALVFTTLAWQADGYEAGPLDPDEVWALNALTRTARHVLYGEPLGDAPEAPEPVVADILSVADMAASAPFPGMEMVSFASVEEFLADLDERRGGGW